MNKNIPDWIEYLSRDDRGIRTRQLSRVIAGLFTAQLLTLNIINSGGLENDPITNETVGAIDGIALGATPAAATSEPSAPAPSVTESNPILPSPESAPMVCIESSIAWLPPTVSRWHPYVVAVATEFNFPPEILEILMTFESLGHPEIVSEAGAVGLVQILPTTAEGLAQQLAMPSFDLTNPKDNIRLSGQYIRNVLHSEHVNLSDGYSAEVMRRVAIAYHAGGGGLRQYVASGVIPGPRTTRYANSAAQAWDDRLLSESGAYNTWMGYKGAQALRDAAATHGQPPC